MREDQRIGGDGVRVGRQRALPYLVQVARQQDAAPVASNPQHQRRVVDRQIVASSAGRPEDLDARARIELDRLTGPKAYDFHMTNQNLAKKARNLETAEEELARLWGSWQGMGEFAPRVEYPSDFSLRDLTVPGSQVATVEVVVSDVRVN